MPVNRSIQVFLVFLVLVYGVLRCETVCSESSVRLVNGATERDGRVEVCVNGQWGTICDDTFTDYDARVVCNQLGYSNSVISIYDNAFYGSGEGTVWALENLPRCTGMEENIFDCRMLFNDMCLHSNDVGIWCNFSNTGDCIEGSVRLSNGTTENEGRIEVCYTGYWGSICEYTFGIFDGQVVCRQLGYSDESVEVFYEGAFGPEFYWIWLEDLHCIGSENNILNCPQVRGICIGNYVAIRCSNESVNSDCVDGSIRLAKGSEYNQGRLEVCYTGQWGTVCEKEFDTVDASVACSQLGFQTNGTDDVLESLGIPGTPVLLSRVRCVGNETGLFQCNSLLGSQYCSNNETVVGIKCNNETGECQTGSIRLANGSSENEGRVEVCFLNQWGTVCRSDQFDELDERVVCRQLGYTLEIAEIITTVPGEANSSIWLTDLFCFGTENNLFECPRQYDVGSFRHCGHDKDVALRCFNMIGSPQQPSAIQVIGSSDIKTSVSLLCQVFDTTGVLTWEWELENQPISSGDQYEITTKGPTSTLIINGLRLSYSGSYTCSVYYQGFVKESTHTITKQLVLTAELSTPANEVLFSIESVAVTFICELNGYLSDMAEIKWRRNGQTIISVPGKYSITMSRGDINNTIDSKGVLMGSMISTLTIYTLLEADSGPYQCTTPGGDILDLNLRYYNLSETFSATSTTSSSVYIATSQTATFTTTQTTTFTTSTATMIVVASDSPSSVTSQNSDNTATIITGSTVSVLVIILVGVMVIAVLIIVLLRHKRHSKKNNLTGFRNNHINENLYHSEKNIELVNQSRKMSDNLLSNLIKPSNLKLLEKIGQGEFGIVYRGLLTEYEKSDPVLTPVAVKTLKGHYSDTQIEQLIEEAEKMKVFDHLNVLTLTGICLDLLDSPCIVMPFMSNGSLLSYLRKESHNLSTSESTDENVILDTTKELLSMCLQVAKGMAYLAKQRFVHRDLAARNCMISSDGVIKVADFGLAEDIYTAEYFKQSHDSDEPVKLPIKWMALESIHYGKFNEKTDVWSFGIVCWEVFTLGRSPYPGLDPRSVIRMLDGGERLDKPSTPSCTQEMYFLMTSCWDKSPDKRPSFSDLESGIEKIIAPLANYMDFSKLSFSVKCSVLDS